MGRRLPVQVEQMKKYLFSMSMKKGCLNLAILLCTVLLLITFIVITNPNMESFTISQSMLLVSGLAALYAAFSLRIKKRKWFAWLMDEGLLTLLILGITLVIPFTYLKLLSSIPSANQARFLEALREPTTFLYLAGNCVIYVFFRLVLILWQRINHLRKEYFSWSLTYYFLSIIVFIITFLMLSAAIYYFFTKNNNPYFAVTQNLWGRTFSWLVHTIVPGFGLTVVFLFFGLFFLIPPFILFSSYFAKKLTKRLNHLGDAAAALRKGDLQARSPVEGSDEISQLQSDFNNMAENLEKSIKELNNEKEIVNNLLNERKELIASVSHELRTPITTILNYLDAIKSQINKKRNKELTANLEMVTQETQRLNLIINDLFDLSRAEVGHLTVKKEDCDIPEIIRNAVEAQKALAWQNRHVDLIYQAEPDLSQVQLDRDRLMQILSNLIRNGIQHTPPGGIVQVSASQADNTLVITVTDTGEGISPEDLPFIWKRFYKGDNSRGNGLGLSVVKELTELMDGTISVKSEPGTGSEFKISFPCPKRGQ